MNKKSVTELPVQCINGASVDERTDALAIEEPLEIRLGFEEAGGRRTQKSVSVTMRTPGGERDDCELAVGFLFTEGIVRGAWQIEAVRHCGPPTGAMQVRNVVRVEMKPGAQVDLKKLERHFYTTSSCGVCGKTSLQALQTAACAALPRHQPIVTPQVIHEMPARLLAEQDVFRYTGGLHAAALFDARGDLLALREDVGRHNALDKLIGAQVLAGTVPLSDAVLLVSGRASFELVQKALVAGIPVLAAVGAPSSLAVELARERGMTLLGFVRGGRFNIYTGEWRIRMAQDARGQTA